MVKVLISSTQLVAAELSEPKNVLVLLRPIWKRKL